jgi:hypothetical protein
MTLHLIRSPLCAAVLLSALVSAPALVQAESPTPGASSGASSAPAKAASHAPKKADAAHTLDLQTPPLNHLYARQQLQYILAVDNSDVDDAQEVSVKGEKYLMPVPTSQFQAIPWALMHPSQAWRVFTPIEAP